MDNPINRRYVISSYLNLAIGVVLFIVFASFALYSAQYYLLATGLVPFLIYYSLFEFEKIYYFIVLTTPLSVGLQWIIPNAPFNISLPSEVLMALMMLIIIFKILKSNLFSKAVFLHPVTIAVLISLLWMFITSITSSMPLVSFKYLLARFWFVFPLYLFPVVLFRNKKLIIKSLILYIVAFAIVIIYSISKHLTYGLFDKDAAHFVMQPFYNDHTSYGAILAMYLPVIVTLLFIKQEIISRLIFWMFLVLYTAGIVLSYTRAAWISVLAAIVLGGVVYMRLKIRYLLIVAGIAVALLFTFRLEIIDKLSKNKQDSSTELSEHVKSISNIATDASNLERINRWNSALKMIEERPVFGWGPGTYMFQYAPFQMARDKTIISTNFAEGGNAHSEYIGPMTEQGIPGLFTFLAIAVTTFYTGFRLYYRVKDKLTKRLVLMSLLSLTTYFIHGLLNNYLDTDKASVPFWGMIAIIVSLDLHCNKNKNPQLGGAEER